MSKKILIVLPGDKLAGAEKVLNSIAEQFYQMEFNVIVIIWYVDKHKTDQWELLKSKYQIFEINETSLKGLYKLAKIIQQISKQNLYLTMSSNITLNSILGTFRKANILKTHFLVVREPSSPFLRYNKSIKLLLYKFKYYLGYRYVDFLIFQTNLMRKVFFQNISIFPDSDVFPNPIDFETTIIKSKENDLMLTDEEPYIIAAGRFIDEKGFDVLIKAFASLTNKKVKLVILGSGPLDLYLHTLVEELGLIKKVIFPGFVHNPFPYFKKAVCCVVSSRVEGFPNTLLQMLALNNNVISTRCCGDLENIPGIELVNTDDVKELSSALERKMSTQTTMSISKRKEIDAYLKARNSSNYVKRLLDRLK